MGRCVRVKVESAHLKEEARADVVLLAHFSYVAVAKTQLDAESWKQLQQFGIVGYQLGKLGLFGENGSVHGGIIFGKITKKAAPMERFLI